MRMFQKVSMFQKLIFQIVISLTEFVFFKTML